ncbi:MAG TPA: ACT domain-containing protein [Methanothermobacter sp.]|nr:amino acid-binding ACT domain-containing protein [Methanothermobacter sp. MT-2]HHW04416.1 ACT domain-containing protein [Methanothermobacter sp.]HOK72978.1 ACT domain-containing protein [Methanothermobacter sp.]HOL69284.1 ACT domain-containing protein [Methanothermobacter sp.]HPQ04502.1 ACT domain-containing protein [Methanothermobacter sp.]
MWEKIKHKFQKYPARINVAKKIVELGFRVDPTGKIYCGNVEISDMALARAANVDRRTVRATTNVILQDDDLKEIFEKIIPAGALLKETAKSLEFGVVEIEANANSPGILAKAASLIASENISIRQAHASDPELEERPKLTIITEKPIPGNLLKKFLKIKGVKRVSIY